jgi:hypothetical protein
LLKCRSSLENRTRRFYLVLYKETFISHNILSDLVVRVGYSNMFFFLYARYVKISIVKIRCFHWQWISWIDSCALVAFLAVNFSS